MTHQCFMAVVVLGGILLAGTVAAAPSTKGKPSLRGTEPGASFDYASEMDRNDETSRLCAERTQNLLPLKSVPTSTLALHDITIHVESGYYTVLLPLVESQRDMRSLYWGADTMMAGQLRVSVSITLRGLPPQLCAEEEAKQADGRRRSV
jgi:hypothetical protein